MKVAVQDKSRFGVFLAARQGYTHVAEAWRYYLRISLAALALHVATIYGIDTFLPESGLVTRFLWGLPAEAALSLVLFLQARLILCGEVFGTEEWRASASEARNDMMETTIIVQVLVKMFYALLFTALVGLAESGLLEKSSAAKIGAALIIGCAFWGLRFTMMHVLAAVGQSMKAFFWRVHGLGVSARVFGLIFCCTLPFVFLREIMIHGVVADVTQVTDAMRSFVLIVSGVLSYIVNLVLGAALVYALKDMMGKDLKTA